jgi:hypothetical protein
LKRFMAMNMALSPRSAVAAAQCDRRRNHCIRQVSRAVNMGEHRHQLDVIEAARCCARRGVTVVAILYDLNLAAMLADRIWCSTAAVSTTTPRPAQRSRMRCSLACSGWWRRWVSCRRTDAPSSCRTRRARFNSDKIETWPARPPNRAQPPMASPGACPATNSIPLITRILFVLTPIPNLSH